MSDQEVKAPEATDVQMTESTEVKPEGGVEVKADASEPTTAGDQPAEAQTADANDAAQVTSKEPSILNPPQNMLKVKRPEKIEKGKNQNKFDVSNQEETSDPVLIRRQVSINAEKRARKK